MQTQFNRAWKRRVYMMTFVNRAGRRNAARIVAQFGANSVQTEETAPIKLYARPYVDASGNVVRTATPDASLRGPFKTMRAAQYFAANPGCPSIAAAEKLSKV
jgi:hypothetical protein